MNYYRESKKYLLSVCLTSLFAASFVVAVEGDEDEIKESSEKKEESIEKNEESKEKPRIVREDGDNFDVSQESIRFEEENKENIQTTPRKLKAITTGNAVLKVSPQSAESQQTIYVISPEDLTFPNAWRLNFDNVEQLTTDDLLAILSIATGMRDILGETIRYVGQNGYIINEKRVLSDRTKEHANSLNVALNDGKQTKLYRMMGKRIKTKGTSFYHKMLFSGIPLAQLDLVEALLILFFDALDEVGMNAQGVNKENTRLYNKLVNMLPSFDLKAYLEKKNKKKVKRKLSFELESNCTDTKKTKFEDKRNDDDENKKGPGGGGNSVGNVVQTLNMVSRIFVTSTLLWQRLFKKVS